MLLMVLKKALLRIFIAWGHIFYFGYGLLILVMLRLLLSWIENLIELS